MDENDNEIILNDKELFSGSIDIISDMKTIIIDYLGENTYKEEVLKILIEMIKKHTSKIVIPIKIYFHGSDDVQTI